MTDGSRTAEGVARGHDRLRLLAAGVCGLQALTLLGFCGFYLWGLAQGASDDPTRVGVSVVFIAVFGGGLGLLGRAWLSGADWPDTPTVVWNVLLLPISWGLFQSERALLGALLAVVALVGIVAAIGADTSGAAET